MAQSTRTTMASLPPELVYTILSHSLSQILFDHLFIAPLHPTDASHTSEDSVRWNPTRTNANALLWNGHPSPPSAGGRPITAVALSRVNDLSMGGGAIATATANPMKKNRNANVNGGPLDEISSLASVCVGWRIIVLRILRAVLLLNDNNNHNLTHDEGRDQLIDGTDLGTSGLRDRQLIRGSASLVTSTPLPHIVQLLQSMQESVRSALHSSIDVYRREQEVLFAASSASSFLGNGTGVATPTGANTPPHPSSLLPNTNSPAIQPLPGEGSSGSRSLDIHAILKGLREEGCTFVHVPVFKEALRFTQASIFTSKSGCSASSSPSSSSSPPSSPSLSSTARSQCSVSLTTTRISNAMELLHPTTSSRSIGKAPIRPKEIAELVSASKLIVASKLERALEVCEWNDVLRGVFLRGERGDEMIEQLYATFDKMEVQAETIELFYLLRSGVLKTIQLISRLPPLSIPGGSDGGGNGTSEDLKNRAAVLSFLWTGRIIGWGGL